MDITFVANDTRGGVDPYLALATEVAARGHRVRFVAPPQYEAAVGSLGGRFVPLRGAEHAPDVARSGRMTPRAMGRRVTDLTARWATDVAECVDGTDLLVSGIGGMSVARPVAQAVGRHLLMAHLQPLDARSLRYPGPLAVRGDLFGPLGRYASHIATEQGVALLTRAPQEAARRALRLSAAPIAPLPLVIYGFSPVVVPVSSDRTTRRTATGYWALPGDEPSDPGLRAFVEQPGHVISIGFGSMVTDDPGAMYRLVAESARRARTRAVLLTGWGAIDGAWPPDGDVYLTSSAPHGWLFPRMAATVHHGGAGTTGAALSAGVPTVIVPFGADQPFWASRAHRLGVSPAPIPRKHLTVESLARALGSALSDRGMADRARRLGQRLRREDGVGDAVDAILAAGGGDPGPPDDA